MKLSEVAVVRANSKKPKLVKPNPGHESPHPMQGKLVGEEKGKMPKQSNPVAKHSKHKSGAGAHKSAKDYNRQKEKLQLKKSVDEVAQNTNVQVPMELINLYRQSLQMPRNSAEFKTLLVQIQRLEKMQSSRLPQMEAIYSASKSEIIRTLLNQVEKEAMKKDENDIKLLKQIGHLVVKKVYKRENGALALESQIPFNQCPQCGDPIYHVSEAEGKKDACYHKVKSRYKVWPSAYASGALVQCRKKGAKNWGNKSKKK